MSKAGKIGLAAKETGDSILTETEVKLPKNFITFDDNEVGSIPSFLSVSFFSLFPLFYFPFLLLP